MLLLDVIRPDKNDNESFGILLATGRYWQKVKNDVPAYKADKG